MDTPTFTPVVPGLRRNRNISYYPNNKHNQWRVCIQRNKKIFFSAYYPTEEEAIRGRDAVYVVLEEERRAEKVKPKIIVLDIDVRPATCDLR